MNAKDDLPDAVVEAFKRYPTSGQQVLLEVRERVLAIANSDPEIGELTETLRWGELSYLTKETGSGSMIRLAMTKSSEPAVFFLCSTVLVDRFRQQYTHVFEFEKNRALILNRPIDEIGSELNECLKQALRYKIDAP